MTPIFELLEFSGRIGQRVWSKREKKNIELFYRLQYWAENSYVNHFARITREVIEEEGSTICYVNSDSIAEKLVTENLVPPEATVHHWFGRRPGTGPMHGIPLVIEKFSQIAYFIDSVGDVRLRLAPKITILHPGDSHDIFGKPGVEQKITRPLIPADFAVEKSTANLLSLPYLYNCREIKSVADFFCE